jgi:hypothetical protein
MKILPPYFSPLLPTIITGVGKYKTRCGEIVTIEQFRDELPNLKYHGRYSTGQRDGWTKSGRCWPSRECDNDIVEKIS